MANTISIKLNQQTVKAKLGQTILSIAKANHIKIPTLCHLSRGASKDTPRAVCRICVVEITGIRGLVSACSTVATEGMQIYTHSNSVLSARRVLMEFILAENTGTIDGERIQESDTIVEQLCKEMGIHQARFTLSTNQTESKPYSSEYFTIDPSKCIHCDRCIVACETQQVITRTGFGNRVINSFGGHNQGIDESDCNYCGDCVAVCPAGGITMTRQ